LTTIAPGSADDACAALALACRDRQRVWIHGAGTKRGWGPPLEMADADLVLSTAKLNAVVAHRHGDLTATVQAGATLDAVNRSLARHGQWLPLDPPAGDRATIGGIVATNDSGPRRHRYGAPRDLIIGVEIVRADGILAKAGGIVVKNVAGYDLSRLVTGSFGSLGLIVSATFKLYPLPSASRTVVIDCSMAQMRALLSTLLDSQLTPSAIELQTPPERLLVRFETIDLAADQQAASVVSMAERERATASIVLGEDERAAWVEHVRRPWAGDGAVVRISVLPAAVVPMAEWLIGAFDGAEIVGRVGVLLARIGGDAHEQARAITELRGRIPAGQGSAVVVRGSDELKSRIDVWGPIGDGLPMMRAIKQQFDPRAILNPGRGPGGL